jgi:hypothetical protein
LSPHRKALYNAAREQRMLCRDWLIYITTIHASSSRQTKELAALTQKVTLATVEPGVTKAFVQPT